MTCKTQNVRQLAAEIHARLDACDNGEGMECADLDASLTRYAEGCRNFLNNIREWAQCVFSGKIPFDRETERLWLDECNKLRERAQVALQQGGQREIPCYDLPGQQYLAASLWHLDNLLSNWVSPKLSAAPSPRVPLTGNLEEMRVQVESLDPLPADWRPSDRAQESRYRKAKG